MKKISSLLVLAVVLTSGVAYGQKKKEIPVIPAPKMPVSETTKLITYHDVVEVAGKPNELYDKALAWMNTYYKNPTDVIKDKEPGIKLSGKARFRLEDENPETGQKTPSGIVMYEIIIQFKDGRYRAEITNISWKQPSYYGIEKWVEENNKQYNRNFASYLVQTDKELKVVLDALKTHMKALPKAGSDW